LTAAPAPSRAALEQSARRGVVVLVVRTVVLQLTVLGGNVYLARLLSPGDFGVFAVVQFALQMFQLFGDAGLAAGLIQKKEQPDQRELSTVWWLQTGLALLLVVVVFFSAPYVLRLWPDLPRETDWLLRALSLQLFFTTLRVIPALLLERELKFARLSLLDFMTTLTFYACAAALATADFGVRALIGAVLLQGLVGAILINAMRPWRPSLVVDTAALKANLRFGIPFQGKIIVGFVNAAVTPIYAGALLGKHALGLNNFAQTTAWFPLKLVEILSRVTFPLYSRLQDDREALTSSLGRSVQVCAIATLFFVGLFFGIGRGFIDVVYTAKWQPALPLLCVYAAAISIGFLSPLIASALDALGKPQIIFRLALVWTALNWVVVSLVMLKWRTPLAFAIAYSVHVFAGNLAVVVIVKRLLPDVQLWPRVRGAVIAAAALALAGRFLIDGWIESVPTLVLAVLLALGVFLGVLFVLDRAALKDALALVRKK
jgi:O-antigen/teichoic acid export membrane protein